MINFGGKDNLLKGKKKHIKTLLKKMCSDYKKTLSDISIVLISDEELLKMNQESLNHDYYTDIITYDYCEKNFVSGDLFISYDRIKENAKELNIMFHEELLRIIIHGVLHLLGHKDKTPIDKKQMTLKENYYLNKHKEMFHEEQK